MVAISDIVITTYVVINCVFLFALPALDIYNVGLSEKKKELKN